jgi:hypothetical protein
MYTGFCILSIFWKQKEENINIHVYWVLYSQYSLETERRKHPGWYPKHYNMSKCEYKNCIISDDQANLNKSYAVLYSYRHLSRNIPFYYHILHKHLHRRHILLIYWCMRHVLTGSYNYLRPMLIWCLLFIFTRQWYNGYYTKFGIKK